MAADSTTATSPNGNGTMPPPPSNGTTTTTGDDMTATTDQRLSADEIALYDRQIRLWGAQAQARIRSAHILLVSLRALGTEIAKNLVLAGISSLTIIDDEIVTEEDLGAQYFFVRKTLENRALNQPFPASKISIHVTVKSDGSISDLLGKDESYYRPFDIVIACDHDFMNLSLINTAARFASRPFYAAGIHGFYGYIFADLLGHEFIVEREKSNRATAIGPESMTRSVINVTTKKESKGGASEKTFEIVKKQEVYCPLILANSSPLPMDVISSRRKLKAVPALLPCLRALFDFERTYGHPLAPNSREDLKSFTELATSKSRELQLPPETLRAEFLRSFIQNIGAEIVPTAAFVGGRLSEDVINVLGQREQPIQNFALFDGDSLEGRIYSLYSPPPEATLPMGMGMGMGMDGMNPMAGGGMMDMSMGMGQGMPFAGGMGMPLGNAGAMGMMVDGGMMDASGMVGMSNGMLDNGAFNMVGPMNVESGNGVPVATSGVGAAGSGAATLDSSQDPPRSVPPGEGDTTGN